LLDSLLQEKGRNKEETGEKGKLFAENSVLPGQLVHSFKGEEPLS